MFTGIVEELGSVASVATVSGHARLVLRCAEVVRDASIGDSIAVNGCCLTITSLGDGAGGTGFAADLMQETLRATALGALVADAPVNLERAMSVGQRFGGHLVQGHVDAIGEVAGREELPGTVVLSVRAPAEVTRYLVPKGSVTIDGVSLTVIDVADDDAGAVFTVGLVPHTLAVTTFGHRAVGDLVNLEADVVAKYVERMLAGGTAGPYVTTPPTPTTP